MKLTREQEVLLAEVTTRDEKWRTTKRFAAAEAQKAVDAAILRDAMERDRAVWTAYRADVPKSKLSTVGLGTKATRTLEEILERMAQLDEEERGALVSAVGGVVEVLHHEQGEVRSGVCVVVVTYLLDGVQKQKPGRLYLQPERRVDIQWNEDEEHPERKPIEDYVLGIKLKEA